eukprot:355993-Chlamydomonas_euryale.AAC.8
MASAATLQAPAHPAERRCSCTGGAENAEQCRKKMFLYWRGRTTQRRGRARRSNVGVFRGCECEAHICCDEATGLCAGLAVHLRRRPGCLFLSLDSVKAKFMRSSNFS